MLSELSLERLSPREASDQAVRCRMPMRENWVSPEGEAYFLWVRTRKNQGSPVKKVTLASGPFLVSSVELAASSALSTFSVPQQVRPPSPVWAGL